LEQEPDENLRVADLIQVQRIISNSEQRFERVVGTLFFAGILKERLALLTDRQIGQLVSDCVSNQLGLLDPAMTICEHAAQRLFRSSGGGFTADDIEREQPSCPKCRSGMIHNFGIDEPDFWACDFSGCEYRIPVEESENWRAQQR